MLKKTTIFEEYFKKDEKFPPLHTFCYKQTSCHRKGCNLKKCVPNLSFAPLRLLETKQVLCQYLQQGHEAGRATSQLEGTDFTTDFYLIVCWRNANECTV